MDKGQRDRTSVMDRDRRDPMEEGSGEKSRHGNMRTEVVGGGEKPWRLPKLNSLDALSAELSSILGAWFALTLKISILFEAEAYHCGSQGV
ncbi:hypothetical protein LOK49_LG10G02012 [Camellia lanceoleosa]|uniref:Uncharacterized protein n=1 Tax=Camellia lanceoleosa TaxID=1840588 RepID=A0ACC0GCI4_9ERIC|nr:hypothetical protein LOK49_LG10G02012 [Camellia lanceoleosa]